MRNSQRELYIHIDESIHDSLGFIMTAFVCSQRDINSSVAKALLKARLQPEKDEFKSGSYMSSNPTMQTLRDDLLTVAYNETKIALLISSSQKRTLLGKDTIEALEKIAIRNGLDLSTSSVFFDQGIVRSVQEGINISKQIMPSGIKMYFEQDSKIVMGLQVADVIAHTSAQVLREQITGKPKSINIGGENTGYEEGTMANLGWSLLMNIRRCFFVRPIVYTEKSKSYDQRTNPVVLEEQGGMDDISISQRPDLLGWGVIATDDLEPEISRAVQIAFDKIWLGCIH